MTKQLIAQNGRNRLKESLDGVPQIIDGLKGRLEKVSSQSEQQFYKEQIRLAQAYQVEMRSYTPELPDTTFTQSHVIKDRAHELHIEFHGRAHTAGDVIVFCLQKRAVATGDMIIGFLPNLADGYPRDWPRTIDSVAKLAADWILPGHGAVQPDHQRMIQMRDYIEELAGLIETGKKAGKPLAELQNAITISTLKSLKANGYGTYVDENLKRFSVYLSPRTALEDRLRANVEAIYNNLDRA
jgi:glyoxylase-like metal-dependent hydrolase (beta-lactamase superfamily II)